MRAYESTGFWGGIAHLIGLVMLGLLLAAVVSVPSVVITQMTLLVHMELKLDEPASEKIASGDTNTDKKPSAKPARKRASKKKKVEPEDAAAKTDSDSG
jgi:hypothetical protein